MKTKAKETSSLVCKIKSQVVVTNVMICSSAGALGTASSCEVGTYFMMIDDCLCISTGQQVMILMCKWSPLSLGGFVPNTLPEINSSQMKMASQKERLTFQTSIFLGKLTGESSKTYPKIQHIRPCIWVI